MKIKKRREKKTLAVSATCPVQELPNVLGKSYGDIMEVIKKRKTYPAGAPFVIYKNDNMDALQIEVGMPVGKVIDGEGQVKAGVLPGGLCAVARHKGPYDTIKKTYDALAGYIKEKGKEPAGPCYELYLNDPQKVSPEKLKTDVVFVLKQ